MKLAVKHIGVFLLTVVYCFAMCAASKPSIRYEIQEASTAKKVAYSESVSASLFSHTPQAELSIDVPETISVSDVEIPFKDFQFAIHTTEAVFDATFYQYTHNAKNFLIHYRKADHLFPFHYYW